MPQATERAQNAGDQQLATMGLSTPQDVRARLLHRLVSPIGPMFRLFKCPPLHSQHRPHLRLGFAFFRSLIPCSLIPSTP